MPMKGGILMRIDGSVYNHLSANLIPKKRNLTHKSSELKEVYKNILYDVVFSTGIHYILCF